MKLLLFLISLGSFSIFGSTCNQGGHGADMQNESDTMNVVTDTLPSSVDTSATMMNGQPASSLNPKADTLSKDTKYETSPGKQEAPKHNSPDQVKLDSIKAAKMKKKG